MWNDFWKWAADSYALHAAVLVLMLIIVFFPGRINRALGRFKKLKAGPLELQAGEEISPDTPCPYTKSRDTAFEALRKVDGKVDRMYEKLREISAIVKSMSIDQQKQLFYDQNQPDAERLAGGLKYICQGGNGIMKPDVAEFAEKHKDIYNALTYIKPELRLNSGKKKQGAAE